MKESEFLHKLLHKFFHDCYEFPDRNIDFFRFRTSMRDRITRRLKDNVYALARRIGFVRRHFAIKGASECLTYILTNIDELETFYELLCDEYSRQLLIELLAFRVLGSQQVKLSINDKEYWKKRASIDKDLLQERNTLKTLSWPGTLNRYPFNALNGLLKI